MCKTTFISAKATKYLALSAMLCAGVLASLFVARAASAQSVPSNFQLPKNSLFRPKVSQQIQIQTSVLHFRTLNMKVTAFARSKMGVQVGNGECWTLANEALRAAGAQQPGTNGLGTYQFGNPVNLNNVIPGDILQFENIKFVAPNGAWNSFPHHTAIVGQKQGNRIELIHQNVNGNRNVSTGWIDLSHRQPGGSILAYRPR